MDLQRTLEEIAASVAPLVGQHAGADYIPGLEAVDTDQFGMAVATTSGDIYGTGNWTTPFSIQSISKVFTLALVLASDGENLGGDSSGNHPETPSTPSCSSSTKPASHATHSSTPAPS